MAEPEETYVIYEPQAEEPLEALLDVIRQLNIELLRIAEKLADKADA